MCGIIAAFNTDIKTKKKEIKATPVNKFIINQFEDQATRGQKGFGIIRIKEDKTIELDRATEPIKFFFDLHLPEKQCNMIIAHHRMPTSSGNYIDQTHPMFVSNNMLKYDYLIVHNGVVTNDKELKTKHEELGFKYTTEYLGAGNYQRSEPSLKWNDSESLAIELALFIEDKVKAIGMDNTAAFIILQMNKETGKGEKVYFGRNGNADLKMCKTNGQLKISSEGPGEEVKEEKLYYFDVKDPSMSLKSKKLKFKEREIVTHTHPAIKEDTESNAIVAVSVPHEQKIGFSTESSKLKDERTGRAWMIEGTEALYEEFPPQLEKSYRDDRIRELKEELKTLKNSEDVREELDTAMEDEIEKIQDLIEKFKDLLLTDKLGTPERSYFIGQIALLMRTMNEISDEAEKHYEALRDIEVAIAEDEQAKEEFATGYSKKNLPSNRIPFHLRRRFAGDSEDEYPGVYD